VDPDGLQAAAPGATPFPLPLYIPPVAIPGSKENKAFAESVSQIRDMIDDFTSNLASRLEDDISEAISDAIERQAEYEQMKALSDMPRPPGRNDCASLSRKIDLAERVIKLYEKWDAKWNPGCHTKKIQDWKQRLQNLKDEHRRRCTQK
jgi:hypothetical protein